MTATAAANATPPCHWVKTRPLATLRQKGVLIARVEGKQIALFDTPEGVRACDNRCPHEGFPLAEGSLGVDCVLTCNWHNWKFSLLTGDNLYNGDRLRVYPVEIRGDQVWVDIADPPYEKRYASVIANLREAFDDHEYDRIGREIARLQKIGADPLDALRLAIEWSWNRMEFGWTHAYPGMADWLTLYDEFPEEREIRLACLIEAVAHTAFDVLREPEFAYTTDRVPYDGKRLTEAIEAEDETTAVALVRGGLESGLGFGDFEPALSRAALAHYNDFGHSLIYVTKAGELIGRLGEAVAEPLLLALVRSLVFAPREDRIPEFRDYARALEQWGSGDGGDPGVEAWRKKGIHTSLKEVVRHSNQAPEKLYRALLEANALNMLCFDVDHQDAIRVTASDNVGWLDFTHGLTFANAVRRQCTRYPELWPEGLLQMACFNGRNAAFTLANPDLETWQSAGDDAAFRSILDRVIDHGQQEYIISVHWLKTALAVREEVEHAPAPLATRLVAALNRFLGSRQKRRQSVRTAYQSLQFVDRE